MFGVILLTIAGWLIEAGISYSFYRVISRRVPALLYRILLTWVFLQVINTLAALTTYFVFQEEFSLLLFYVLLIALSLPFVVWAFLERRRRHELSPREPLAANEKTFLLSFGILFLILVLSTARHGFMPMWGNVDMANQHSSINAFHAKMLPGWRYAFPHVVQAAPALRESANNWGYIFGYNFLVALISRLTFAETIYVLNFTSCFNMALWLSAPLLLVEWKKTTVWTILYWIWVAFTVQDWYSAVDRGWLTSIYSLGQCLIVLACVFYIHKRTEKSSALLYLSIGIGSFMVANAHPYNYPIFFLSVLLMALFSGERRFGRRILRSMLYGLISMVSLLPLFMETAFKKVFDQIFGFLFAGNIAGLFTIRDFEMMTAVKAPMWIGIGGMIAALAVVLILIRSVKKGYIVGISAVATVVGLYAVYGSSGYLYQKEFILTPPLFFMLALHLIHDLWLLIYQKWIAGRVKFSSEKMQAYILAPLLIAALLVTGQISLKRGIAPIQDHFIDVKPMVEPGYYQASKVIGRIIAEGGQDRSPVNFRTLDGARKMFLARIVREDDLAQAIPDLDYYAVETTSYEKLIQYADMVPDKKRPAWEKGMYLVHDRQEYDWPQYQTLAMLMADTETIFSSGDTVVTRMRLKSDLRSAYFPLAGGVVPVRVERTNAITSFIEDFGQGTMAYSAYTPAVLAMDNPLADTSGDLLFLFRGHVSEPGRVTLRVLDTYGREISHSVLPAFDGLTTVVIPREDLGQGAARIEIVMEPGSTPADAAMQWMRLYVIPDGE